MALTADINQPIPSDTLVLIVPRYIKIEEAYYPNGITMSLFQNQMHRIVHYDMDDVQQVGSMFCCPSNGYYRWTRFFTDACMVYEYKN